MTQDEIISNDANKLLSEYENFWKTRPAFKTIDPSKNKIANQGIRHAILDILREGIEESPIAEGDDINLRHIMTAQELLGTVNDRVENNVKLSNIYFHLNELIKASLVEEVTTIPDGKHRVAYFGRTAKLFIFKEVTKIKKMETTVNKEIVRIITQLNPNSNKKEINKLMDEYSKCCGDIHEKVFAWFEQNANLVSNVKMDLSKLYDFIYRMSLDNSDIRKKLATLLNLPLD